MKNFVCVRIKKLKTFGDGGKNCPGIKGLWKHDMRLIDTPNACMEHFDSNVIICDETDWNPQTLTENVCDKSGCREPDFIEKKAKHVLEKYGITVAKDQVLCTNLLAFVSPEYLRNGDISAKLDREKVQKMLNGTIKMFRKKFGDRLLCVVLHLDESNPHFSAYVVPLIEKSVKPRGRRKKANRSQEKPSETKWRLSCCDLFTPDRTEIGHDPSDKLKKTRIQGTCSLLQDEYAEALRQEGLDVQRGVVRASVGPALEYESNKIRYRRMTEPVAEIDSMSDAVLRAWAKKAAQLASEAQRAKHERDYYQKEAANAQQSLAFHKKAQADAARDIPVADIISALFSVEPYSTDDLTGNESTATSTQKGDTPGERYLLPNGQRIQILENNRFENLTPEIPFGGLGAKRKRGQGALDAVQFLTGWSFEDALDWIADTMGVFSATRACSFHIKQRLAETPTDADRLSRKEHAALIRAELVTRNDSKWDQVRKRVVSEWKLAPEIVDQLHEQGWLASNVRGHLLIRNGAYTAQSQIVAEGVFVIDIANPDIVLLEESDSGVFMDISKEGKGLILCSSPVDALALRQDAAHAKETIIAVGKTPPTPEVQKLLTKLVRAHGNVIQLSEDKTSRGAVVAKWCRALFPSAKSLILPREHKTWLSKHLDDAVKRFLASDHIS